jgi:hypothetical protein
MKPVSSNGWAKIVVLTEVHSLLKEGKALKGMYALLVCGYLKLVDTPRFSWGQNKPNCTPPEREGVAMHGI